MTDASFLFTSGSLTTPITTDLAFVAPAVFVSDLAPDKLDGGTVYNSGLRANEETYVSKFSWPPSLGAIYTDSESLKGIGAELSVGVGERHVFKFVFDGATAVFEVDESVLASTAAAVVPPMAQIGTELVIAQAYGGGGQYKGAVYAFSIEMGGEEVLLLDPADAGLQPGPVADGTTFTSNGRVWTVHGTGVSYTPPPSFFTFTDIREDCISTPYTADMDITDGVLLEADVEMADWDGQNQPVSNGDPYTGGQRLKARETSTEIHMNAGSGYTQRSFYGGAIPAGRHTIAIGWDSVAGSANGYLDGDEYGAPVTADTQLVGNQGDDFKIGFPDHGTYVGMVGDVYGVRAAASGVDVVRMDPADAGLQPGPVADGTTFTSNGRVWTVHGTGVSYTGPEQPPTGAASRLSVLRNRDKIKTLTPGSVRLER